jgi:hypothetical protein
MCFCKHLISKIIDIIYPMIDKKRGKKMTLFVLIKKYAYLCMSNYEKY